MVTSKPWLLALVLVHLALSTHAEVLKIPSGAEITLDGRMHEGEWSDALEIDFVGGESLRLKQDGRMEECN